MNWLWLQLTKEYRAANKDNKFLNDASCAIFQTEELAVRTNLRFRLFLKNIGPFVENKYLISDENQLIAQYLCLLKQ